MGWTWYRATKYKNGGSVDRKAELDTQYRWGDKYEVLKSAMVGSTYYAAVKHKETGEVFAAVFLTSTYGKEYHNFGYKDMDETCGPCESKCPTGILALLTETESEFALKWREKCRQYHADKKSPSSYANLPLGTKVIWTVPHDHFVNFEKGQKAELVKQKFGKRLTAWVSVKGPYRINAKHVDAKDIEIIEQ
jgi:hypothetical protein